MTRWISRPRIVRRIHLSSRLSVREFDTSLFSAEQRGIWNAFAACSVVVILFVSLQRQLSLQNASYISLGTHTTMKQASRGLASPTPTAFSDISNYRSDSYRPLRYLNGVPGVPTIDYRQVAEIHYAELGRYLISYLAKGAGLFLLSRVVPVFTLSVQAPPNSRSSARSKLTTLTIQQCHEISTDFYDEVLRRKNENGGTSCGLHMILVLVILSSKSHFFPSEKIFIQNEIKRAKSWQNYLHLVLRIFLATFTSS